MSESTTAGIDLATNVLAAHIVARGEDPACVAEDRGDEAQGFPVDCLRAAPGGVVGTTIALPGIRLGVISEWVTLWARDPEAVRVRPLEVLAGVEVGLEQLE